MSSFTPRPATRNISTSSRPLPGLRIERVAPTAAMAAEELAVDEVRGTRVVGHLLRRLRHRQRELVEVGHRRHGASLSALELGQPLLEEAPLGVRVNELERAGVGRAGVFDAIEPA